MQYFYAICSSQLQPNPFDEILPAWIAVGYEVADAGQTQTGSALESIIQMNILRNPGLENPFPRTAEQTGVTRFNPFSRFVFRKTRQAEILADIDQDCIRLHQLIVPVGIQALADLDLHGVRIARLVQRWAPSATPWHMAPEDLRRAAVSKSLSQSEAAAIRRDLESRPDEVLSVTLRAFLDERATVEQEALLGQI